MPTASHPREGMIVMAAETDLLLLVETEAEVLEGTVEAVVAEIAAGELKGL